MEDRQGPSPILCEQPDRTALLQPNRPVTNVMPATTRPVARVLSTAASPLIAQVVAIGDRRPYVVALIVLDPDVAAVSEPTAAPATPLLRLSPPTQPSTPGAVRVMISAWAGLGARPNFIHQRSEHLAGRAATRAPVRRRLGSSAFGGAAPYSVCCIELPGATGRGTD